MRAAILVILGLLLMVPAPILGGVVYDVAARLVPPSEFAIFGSCAGWTGMLSAAASIAGGVLCFRAAGVPCRARGLR